jgi:hypothetical protein
VKEIKANILRRCEKAAHKAQRIKMNVSEIISLDVNDFQDLERQFFENIPLFFSQFLMAAEEKIISSYYKGYKVVKTVRRKLKTIVGEIEFKYRVLTDGKKVISPLFDSFGLKKRQRVSEDLKSCAKELVVDQSYRKSCEIFSTMKGVKISHSSLWKCKQ